MTSFSVSTTAMKGSGIHVDRRRCSEGALTSLPNYMTQCKACRERRRPSRGYAHCEVCRRKTCPDCVQVYKKAVLLNCNKTLKPSDEPKKQTERFETTAPEIKEGRMPAGAVPPAVSQQTFILEADHNRAHTDKVQAYENGNRTSRQPFDNITAHRRHTKDVSVQTHQVQVTCEHERGTERPHSETIAIDVSTENSKHLDKSPILIATEIKRTSDTLPGQRPPDKSFLTPSKTFEETFTCCQHTEEKLQVTTDTRGQIAPNNDFNVCKIDNDLDQLAGECKPKTTHLQVPCHRCQHHSRKSRSRKSDDHQKPPHKTRQETNSETTPYTGAPVVVSRYTSSNSEPEKTKYNISSLHQFALLDDVYIKSENDSNDCDISGMTLLSPYELVLVDKNNKKLKLVDLKLQQLMSEIVFQYTVRSVCTVPDRKVGLTVPDRNLIKLLALRDNAVVEDRDIECENCPGYCSGLVYCDGCFVVSFVNPAAIHVIRLSGEIIRTFNNTAQFYRTPQYLAVNRDNTNIYISDTSRHTVTRTDLTGAVLDVYTFRGQWFPLSVQAGSTDEFVVCSSNRSTICTVRDTRRQLVVEDIVTVDRPKIMCCCPVNNVMYVTTPKYDIAGEQCNYVYTYPV